MQDFSNILRNLINQHNISQKELAEMAKTTEATISRYLSNERKPHVEVIISIAQALNVSTDYLLGLTPITSNQNFSEDLENLIFCYNKSNTDDKKIIWAVLDKYR